MKRYFPYKIIIGILCLVIIIQTIVIFRILRKKPPVLVEVIKGKIAIVLDDWGYNLENLNLLDEIKYPLTISILPNLNYSRLLAKKLHQKNFEVILHLPLQPHEKVPLEKDTIMTSMDEAKIKEILKNDLANLIYVKGVSNHMGSRATEDARIMGIIFKELKKRKLYFLDSFVSSNSVCQDLAHQMQLKFAKRDIFLDNTEEASYIKNQINKLKIRARIYDTAIGIGHNHKVTLEVLKEMMPKLAKEGYKFVFVSELVK